MEMFANSSSISKGMGEVVASEEPHVLAVDDNLVDRKLVEILLKKSSCKGNHTIQSSICFIYSQ